MHHMTGILIAGICVAGAILFIVTIGLIIIGITRAVQTGGLSQKDKLTRAEEDRMIQDIYHGLSKMEERVEALETILIERQKKDFEK